MTCMGPMMITTWPWHYLCPSKKTTQTKIHVIWVQYASDGLLLILDNKSKGSQAQINKFWNISSINHGLKLGTRALIGTEPLDFKQVFKQSHQNKIMMNTCLWAEFSTQWLLGLNEEGDWDINGRSPHATSPRTARSGLESYNTQEFITNGLQFNSRIYIMVKKKTGKKKNKEKLSINKWKVHKSKARFHL